MGQTFAQGGFLHDRQTITVYPRDIPPVDRTPIQVFDNPALPLRLEQANIQLWQPTHRMASFTDNFITSVFLFLNESLNKIIISNKYRKDSSIYWKKMSLISIFFHIY